MARPIDMKRREEQMLRMNEAIHDLKAQGKPITRTAVADAMGVTRQAVSFGYLCDYLDSLNVLGKTQDPESETVYFEAEIEKWKAKYNAENALRKKREKELRQMIEEKDKAISALSNEVVHIRTARYEHERRNRI